MSAHLSEEEQVEALKRWWKKNGRTTIIAVVLGIGVWWGYGQWTQHQEQVKESNSILYIDMMTLAEASSLNEEQRTELASKAQALKEHAQGTQYDWYAAMILARLAVEKEDFDAAAAELQHVLNGDADQGLKDIAQLRLARVEASRGNLDKALQLLATPESGTMMATYAEVRGDLLLQQGDTEAARAAYQEAVNRASDVDREALDLLNLKLNRVMPAGQAAEPEENESAQQPE